MRLVFPPPFLVLPVEFFHLFLDAFGGVFAELGVLGHAVAATVVAAERLGGGLLLLVGIW